MRARVGVYTDVISMHSRLAEHAEEQVVSDTHRSLARLLRAEIALRQGPPRPALVKALRVAAMTSAGPELQLRALALAVACRLTLQQPAEAALDLERAMPLLEASSDPLDAIRIGNIRADMAFSKDDLLWCRALCQENIRAASQRRYVRGAARSAHRLGRVLRMLGRRREAEHQIRSAREAFSATGDLSLDAETRLALVSLLAERGDTLPAGHLLDETIRRIRGLAMGHLMPTGLRLVLQLAILTDNTADAAMALADLEETAPMDPEAPALIVRWLRSRGSLPEALAIDPPPRARSFGGVLYLLERSRTALLAGDDGLVIAESNAALAHAKVMGFSELELYAKLLLGTVTRSSDDAWAELQREATDSMFTEVFLGALELDARRVHRVDPAAAVPLWRALHARSRELGYRPGVAEASGWLSETR